MMQDPDPASATSNGDDHSPPTKTRRWLFLVPVFAIIALLAFGMTRRGEPPQVGKPAPDFSAPLLQGRGGVILSGLRGEPVFINFWASWCVPCKKEAPLIRRAFSRYGERIHFVGVDSHDSRSDALHFVNHYRLTNPMVVDVGNAIYQRYALTGQPESFFLDARGRLVEHVPGEIPSQAALNVRLRNLLSGVSP